MLGAIVGDIVGSVYEWHNIHTKNFPFFRGDCFFTDDTVMTCAVAEAVMNGGRRDDFIDAMKKYGAMYPNVGYGIKFLEWLMSDNREPYHSFGNGSAMRVSPCAWIMDCGFYARMGMLPERGRKIARLSAEVTHDHPEGIKGALATVDAIFLSRFYFGNYSDNRKSHKYDATECKLWLKNYIERTYGYDLSRRLNDIRITYKYDVTCPGTVPEAIISFLESTDFEDAIRNAICIGGDSDTLAAITGSIAEAAYGIPDWIQEKAYSYLDDNLRDVVQRWTEFIATNGQSFFDGDGTHKYEKLTTFLSNFAENRFGDWVVDQENDGTEEHPIQLPFVNYDSVVYEFVDAVYTFINTHNTFGAENYGDVLSRANIEWSLESMENADVSALDGQTVIALIVGAIRADRFCEGSLKHFLESGKIAAWLLRLKEIDDNGK